MCDWKKKKEKKEEKYVLKIMEIKQQLYFDSCLTVEMQTLAGPPFWVAIFCRLHFFQLLLDYWYLILRYFLVNNFLLILIYFVTENIKVIYYDSIHHMIYYGMTMHHTFFFFNHVQWLFQYNKEQIIKYWLIKVR